MYYFTYANKQYFVHLFHCWWKAELVPVSGYSEEGGFGHFWTCLLVIPYVISLCVHLGVELLSHRVQRYSFYDLLPNISPKWFFCFPHPQAMYVSLVAMSLCYHSLLSVLFILAILLGGKIVHNGFNLYFLMTNKVEYLHYLLIWHWIFSFTKGLFMSYYYCCHWVAFWSVFRMVIFPGMRT